MDYTTLSVAIADKVATVTLTRPDVRNAFNEKTIAELALVFDELGRNEFVRAIVLAAEGAAFCAGADLNWMKKMAGYSHAENNADAMALADMLLTIYTCPKPVVARIQGDCYAGGMGLVAACDIAVAVEEAHFCLSEVKLGLIPATISPYVIKAMGENASRRYFLTAERFTAREAHRIGFVHETATTETLDSVIAGIVKALVSNGPSAVKLAKALVSNGPSAVKLAKDLVREIPGRQVTTELLADTAERIANIRASTEGREGVASFLEKRKPSWLI